MIKKPIRNDLFNFLYTPFVKHPKKPFKNQQYEEVLKLILRACEMRGFSLLTGAPGLGKSCFFHYLIEHLHPNANRLVYIACSNISERDLLREIALQLGVEAYYQKGKTIKALQLFIEENQPINTILMLDEMQNSSQKNLEMLRLLSNFKYDSKRYLTIILAGSEEILQVLKKNINTPLRQRITLYQRLLPLSAEECALYLSHHLGQAGALQEIFEPAALQLIAEASDGIPRIINHLALSALAEASEYEKVAVTLEHVRRAVELTSLPKRALL